jgi:hypothetical protein
MTLLILSTALRFLGFGVHLPHLLRFLRTKRAGYTQIIFCLKMQKYLLIFKGLGFSGLEGGSTHAAVILLLIKPHTCPGRWIYLALFSVSAQLCKTIKP